MVLDPDVLDSALLLNTVHEVDSDALLLVAIVLDVVKAATELVDSVPVTEVLGNVCLCDPSSSFSSPSFPPTTAMLVEGVVVLVE